MTEQRKAWLKNNVLELVIIAMVGGYFTYDLVEKSDNRSDHKQYEKDITDLKTISYNLGQNCLKFEDWKDRHDEEYDQFRDMTQQEFLELWKMIPRGVVSKTGPTQK